MNFLKLLQVVVWNAFETSAVILTNDDIDYHYSYIKTCIIQQLGLSAHTYMFATHPSLKKSFTKAYGWLLRFHEKNGALEDLL